MAEIGSRIKSDYISSAPHGTRDVIVVSIALLVCDLYSAGLEQARRSALRGFRMVRNSPVPPVRRTAPQI